ncbi:MAG: nitroreductase [Propionibacteriaceae bacterium]|jgi:nitroreductase|nr:nitroreductase [Propionibacteriaceae bacterium]
MTNLVLETIARRYSCRTYTPQPVTREQLEALTLAGTQAPSSRGGAPWRITVVTDPDLIADLSASALRLIARHEPAAAERFATRGTNLFYNAPAVFVMAARHTWDYTSEDLDIGLATQNITLAATSLGLGSVICGFLTQAFRDPKSDDADRLTARLGLPRGYEVRVGIAVGHPATDGTPHAPDPAAVTYL